MKTATIALGGNAILLPTQEPTKETQLKNIEKVSEVLAELIAADYDLVITHGNGPQVGNILIRNEYAKSVIPPMPLDVCVSESQGQIGYLLQQTLTNKLSKIGIKATVISMITQVIVDSQDSAFQNPAKPVGPYYSAEEMRTLSDTKGWQFIEDKVRGGFRRVVPSPRPVGIVEKDAIRKLVFSGEKSGIVVIAAGGGGVPVVKTANCYKGVEAVVDKDLATSILAVDIGEKLLIFLTDVKKVALNFGTPAQAELDVIKLSDAKKYLADGHFPAGSMGPKIEAAIYFLENGGEKVIITTPACLKNALIGKDGTTILPDHEA